MAIACARSHDPVADPSADARGAFSHAWVVADPFITTKAEDAEFDALDARLEHAVAGGDRAGALELLDGEGKEVVSRWLGRAAHRPNHSGLRLFHVGDRDDEWVGRLELVTLDDGGKVLDSLVRDGVVH